MEITIAGKNIRFLDIEEFDDQGYFVRAVINHEVVIFLAQDAIKIRRFVSDITLRGQSDIPSKNIKHVNSVRLVGIIEWEPEIYYESDGTMNCQFILRVDINNDDDVQTSWHFIVAYNDVAEFCSHHCHSNTTIEIIGSIGAKVNVSIEGAPYINSFIRVQTVNLLNGKR